MDKNKVVVLIPGNELTSELVLFVEDLIANDFKNILIFTETEDKNENYKLLVDQFKIDIFTYENEENSLKTRVDVILGKYPDAKGTIVADAAGLYSVGDIEVIASALAHTPSELILGVRRLKRDAGADRPSIGNRLIEAVFNKLEDKISIESDTSLRAFSTENLKVLLENVEEETSALAVAKQSGIPFKTVPIYTDATREEERSYFSRIMDLIKVYKTFFKFTASSLFSTVIDLGLFTLFVYLLRTTFPTSYIMVATILARIVSVIINYIINSKLVFKKEKEKGKTFARFLILAVVTVLASGYIVTVLVKTLKGYETLTKILVDSSLFLAGFHFQKKFIFIEDE